MNGTSARSWIHERLEQRDKQRHDSNTVSQGFHSLWMNLCKEIEVILREYALHTKDRRAIWDVSEPDFNFMPKFITISMTEVNQGTPSVMGKEIRKLELSADYAKCSVSFKNSAANSGGTLRSGLGPDGFVCFVDEDGNAITIEQATERILDTFLFPDLAKPTARKIAAIAS